MDQPLSVTVVPVTPFQQNASILVCNETKEAAVVDPGGDLDRIREALSETGATATQILLTHGHVDHAGGATELAETLGVSIVGPHRDDAFLLADLPAHGARVGIAGARPAEPARWLAEGEEVAVGRTVFSVLEVPGHTPGHLVFHAAALGFVVGGDAVFAGSVGRTDFPYGDHARLIAAIADKLMSLPDDTTILPGHGPATTVGRERATNPFLAETA